MGAINAIIGALPATGAAAPNAATGVGSAAQPQSGFGNSLTGALDNLNSLQANSDDKAIKAATGDLNDVHSYTIAAAEANIATELTVALRNRAVETFNEIMRMQV
jgi:flagellar hook-basal body complex protein FliE